jgi:hypothetical protein
MRSMTEENRFLHKLMNGLAIVAAQCEILELEVCPEATGKLERIHDQVMDMANMIREFQSKSRGDETQRVRRM